MEFSRQESWSGLPLQLYANKNNNNKIKNLKLPSVAITTGSWSLLNHCIPHNPRSTMVGALKWPNGSHPRTSALPSTFAQPNCYLVGCFLSFTSEGSSLSTQSDTGPSPALQSPTSHFSTFSSASTTLILRAHCRLPG